MIAEGVIFTLAFQGAVLPVGVSCTRQGTGAASPSRSTRTGTCKIKGEDHYWMTICNSWNGATKINDNFIRFKRKMDKLIKENNEYTNKDYIRGL